MMIASRAVLGNKLRSLLTVGGVAVGIAAIVFLVSLGFGIQELIVERVTGLDALRIMDVSTVKSEVIKLNEENIGRIRSMDLVEKVEAVVNVPGKLSFGGSTTDVVVFGASPEYLAMASLKPDEGELYGQEAAEVIVNSTVLELVGIEESKYSSEIGSEAQIELWLGRDILDADKDSLGQRVELDVTIKGMIDDQETAYMFIPLGVLKASGVKNFSQAKVMVKDKSKLEDVREQIEAQGFSTSSAADTVQQIDQIFSIFRIALASFGAIALVVASLGMFNTLTVSLLERTREVGLMKALGARRKDVFSLFLSEALLMSAIGGSIGVFLGFLLGEGANYLLNRLAVSAGGQAVDIFQTPLVFAFGVVIFSFLVGFATGIYPSRRAGKLKALDALRYE